MKATGMLAGDGEQNSFNAIHRKFGHNGDARREPRQNAFDTIPISKARYFDTSKVRYIEKIDTISNHGPAPTRPASGR